jgi:hypothetical protein
MVATVWMAGCGAPMAPTPVEPPTWALSGQSNAVLLRPALSRHATIVGAALSGTPIAAWAPDGGMWFTLAATLSPIVSMFVWFQGESDADVGITPGAPSTTSYVSHLRDLVARVRALTRPNLFVVVCGLANSPADQVRFDAMRTELQRFVATDANSVYVSTLDLPSNQSQHLTDEGYVMLAARITALAVPRASWARY